ncbi:MAG: hypothetical protein K2P81_08660 [Bacteriovoracaceae bacterium]|nr:hypothetical protein [Bacteriovoracaceae bacterium]
MKKSWVAIILIAFVALIWWSRRPLPSSDQLPLEIKPAPMNSRPIVHSRIPDKLPQDKRIQIPKDRQYILSHAFINAIKQDPPEGRMWETLPDEEFIAAVEEWSGDLTNQLGSRVTSDELALVGLQLYPERLSSPYARYAALSWAVRFGNLDKKQATRLLLLLASDFSIQQSSEPENPKTEDPEERVTRLLGNAMIDKYGYNLKEIVGEKPKELTEGGQTSGHLRIEAIFEK